MASSVAEMRSLVQRLEEAMNRRDLAALDSVVAPNFVRHCQATPHLDIRDLEGFKAFLRDDAAAFPDNVQTITHIAAEGDLVGIFATYEGTHLGPLGPVPATGKRVKFDFAGVFRVQDGLLSEFWITWDNMTIMGQLGLLPEQP